MAQPPAPAPGPHPLPLASVRSNRDRELHRAAPQKSPLPHQPLYPPTSAPTDPPTSCHCLGSNPSSAPASWRALPGRGAAGPQGHPLMPRRVGGLGLRAGLGPRASTAGACLSASCPQQKPGVLIKNRWARRRGSGCRPRPQPQRFPAQPSAAGGFLPSLALRCCRCRPLPPPPRDRIGLLQSMPPALPMPLSGAGVAPLPGPGL